METTTTTVQKSPERSASLNALAIVGFIALIIIGIGLAVYLVRLIPNIASRFGSGSAITSILNKSPDDASLQVVTSTSTLPSTNDSVTPTPSTVVTPTPAPVIHPTPAPTPAPVIGYTTITTTTTTGPGPLHGDPDLTTHITAVGYLRDGNELSSFERSSYVPDNRRGAVQFTISNVGTNIAHDWRFKVDVPTSPSYTYSSNDQRDLKPGESITYTLSFSRGRDGDDREITVTVDPSHDVHESNESNNNDSERIDIRD